MIDETYSLDLSEEEWREIICLVWMGHNFNLADKIQRELYKKYQNIQLG